MTEREKILKESRDEWKAKNKGRYEEIKALKARLKETVDNRDKWKSTASDKEKRLKKAEQEKQELVAAIARLQEELKELQKKKQPISQPKDRCRWHYYPIVVMLICLRLILHTAISFRGLSEALKILCIAHHYNVEKMPSYSTTRRWINRFGLHNITKEKEKGNDWCYIVDNSVRIEKRKLCLILGVQLSKLKQEGYLSFENIEIIELGIIEGKATESVLPLLESAIEKTGVPLQICSDQGPDVVPAIKRVLSRYDNIKYVPDVIHATTNMLKKIFEKQTRWNAFAKEVGQAKNKLKQSAYSALCPPQIRGKSRFLNCDVVIEWGVKIIELMDSSTCDRELKKKLRWIYKYRTDLIEMQEMIRLVKLANELARSQRIHSETGRIAEVLFESEAKTIKGEQLAQEIMTLFKKLAELAGKDSLIGSSEVIESAFGKLKSLDRECGNSGFSSSVLAIGACFGKLDFNSVSKAMGVVSDKDVEKWKEKNIGETQYSKRRHLFKSKKKEKFYIRSDTNFRGENGYGIADL